MNTNVELIFRAICSFHDGEYADFNLHSIRNACGEDALINAVKTLKTLGSIEDLTSPGCARRYKIPNPVDCPDFIFDTRFPFNMKTYLLEKWNIYKSGSQYVTKEKFEIKLNLMGTTTKDIIENAKPIKNQIEVPENLLAEKTDVGYKIKVKPTPEELRKERYECRYCGDTNKNHFGSQHTICKKCYNSIDRNKISYAERLFKSSRNNANAQHFEHNLTPEYIQELLTKQEYKCCYSGIPFWNDRKDRMTYPIIDRIDSSKGYIKGNVCICTWFVNSMKANLTIDQFKEVITKIYENKDNF